MSAHISVLWQFCLLILFTFSANAQQVQRCHTDEYFEVLKLQDTGLARRVEAARAQAAEYLKSKPTQKIGARSVITIPIVVHVMHNGEAVGTGPNISEAQILSQIEVLNRDYMALNSDLSNVPSHFSSVIGNPSIEFCLAQFDPEGNPTTGIDRVNMGSGSWSDSRKAGTTWNNAHYLNIWTASIPGGTLGYATFPGTSPNSDGVVIDYRYFGKKPENPFSSKFDLGRTATHEIGHWLGLDHTFQGASCAGSSASNCSTQGDRICDTPPTSNPNYGCSYPTSRNTCTETPLDLPDMWMNYLDYMDDACLYMFSQGQVDVVRAVLNTSRASILQSAACQTQNLFSYSGKVVDAQTGIGVPFASVFFKGTYSYELETDAHGNYTSASFREGDYAIYAGKWGYMTREFTTSVFIDAGTATYTIPIVNGRYYDDFILDLGWSTSGTASSGFWERGVPAQTTYNGNISNPGEDIAGDFGDKCYVTGNGGGSAGNDDVDDGNVVLLSPLFDLSGYNEPYVSYHYWFFNDGGQGNPNDELVISLFNGNESVILETIDASGQNNQWTFSNFRVKDHITPTAVMQLRVETADLPGSGHLVEAGFDGFSVVDSMPVSVRRPAVSPGWTVFPNPATDLLLIAPLAETSGEAHFSLFSISGVLLERIAWNETKQKPVQADLRSYPDGIYLLRITTASGTFTHKITVER